MNINLESILEYGREERNIEFKEDQNWDTLKKKIIKTCMAMANLKDGGYMVIGMKELKDGTFELQGMTKENLRTYTRDTISKNVNNYAEPSVNLDIEIVKKDNKEFLFIIVKEFDDTPIICKTDKGDFKKCIYYRAASKIETAEISTYEEVKEVIHLGILKGVRKFISDLSYAGITLSRVNEEEDDEIKFKKQRGEI